MRAYESTHPWLTFTVNLSRAPAKLWTLLGECGSLCRASAEQRLLPDDREALDREYAVRGAVAAFPTSASPLTTEETEALAAGTLDPPPSKRYALQEVENILEAFGRIASGVGLSIREDLSAGALKKYNELVLDRLVQTGNAPGAYRTVDAPVPSGIQPAPAEDCEYLVDSLCDWLNSGTFDSPESMNVHFGILKALFARLYLAWIQPFGAGNAQTAALAEYHILVSSGIPATAAVLPAIHYSSSATELKRRIDAAGRPEGKLMPFMRYAIEGFRDELVGLLGRIGDLQERALWSYYVHSLFRDKTSPADLRRRSLAIELSKLDAPVQIPHILEKAPRLARDYSVLTHKTLTRDINDLLDLGIVEKTSGGLRACRYMLNAKVTGNGSFEQ